MSKNKESSLFTQTFRIPVVGFLFIAFLLICVLSWFVWPNLNPTSTLPSAPETAITLDEAISSRIVIPDFRGPSASLDGGVVLTIRRTITDEVAITVPPGSILVEPNNVSFLVVNRLKGGLDTNGGLQPTSFIQLSDDEWHEYLLGTYSLSFYHDQLKPNASYSWGGSLSTEGSPPSFSEILNIIEVANATSDYSDETVQSAIWAITDGVDQQTLSNEDYSPDLQDIRSIFLTAEIAPERKRLFSPGHPQTAQDFFERGQEYMEKEESIQAFADFDKAIEMNQDYPEALYQRGIILQKQGNYVQAFADFNRVIELDADQSTAYYNRGLIYSALQNYELAIEDFTKVINRNEQLVVEAYYARGEAWSLAGYFSEAIVDFGKVLEKRPAYADAHRMLGMIHYAQENNDLALKHFEQYLNAKPGAIERQDIENLNKIIAQSISLADALQQGSIQANILGMGMVSANNVMLWVKNITDRELLITVLPGTILVSSETDKQNMVVRQLRGQVLNDSQVQLTTVIHLPDNEARGYILEAYGLDFNKTNPLTSTTFAVDTLADSDVLQVLEASNALFGGGGNPIDIQSAIWAVTNNVTWQDLTAKEYWPNMEVVDVIFQVANLDTKCKKLFGGKSCEAVATPSSADPKSQGVGAFRNEEDESSSTSAESQSTPLPTATSVPPTATPIPPTVTPVPPTVTPIPPTATPTTNPWISVADSFQNFPGPGQNGIWSYHFSDGRNNFWWQDMAYQNANGCFYSPNDWGLEICRESITTNPRGDVALQWKAGAGGTYRFEWDSSTLELYNHTTKVHSQGEGIGLPYSAIIEGVEEWAQFFFLTRSDTSYHIQIYKLQE